MTQLQINCDGGSRGNPGPAASAFVVTDINKQTVFESGFYLGQTTNNQAEYQAVVEALKWLTTQSLSDTSVQFLLDSQLVVNQINGTYKVKDPNIKIKYLEVQSLLNQLSIQLKPFMYIPREQNSRADFLVNQTLDSHI